MTRDLLEAASEIVREAMAMAQDATLEQTDQKAHQDFVTNVDMKIDAFLEKSLGALLPDCPVLSEERAADQTGPVAQYWIVDPIDGTLNMIAGLSGYAVSVALVGKDGPVLAVVGDVAQGGIYTALKGQGASHDDKPLTLNEVPPPLIICSTGLLDSLVHADPTAYEALRQLGKVRNFGAQSLHLCGVAAGHFSAALSIEARVWDEAAGGLILREAGGVWQSQADEADWSNPADMMAIKEQRSVAAHPVSAPRARNALAELADLGPFNAASKDRASSFVSAFFGLDKKARRISPLPAMAAHVSAFRIEPTDEPPQDGSDGWCDDGYVCAPEITLDTPLTLTARLVDGTEHYAVVRPDALQETTPPAIYLSAMNAELHRGWLEFLGWAVGTQAPPRVAVSIDGGAARSLGRAKRPDVASRNNFISETVGFRGSFGLTTEEMARFRAGHLTIELRLALGGRSHCCLAVNAPDPADHTEALAVYDILERIKVKAAGASRVRLERLLASDAFRRRWCMSDTSVAYAARSVIAEALIPYLEASDEVWIRLYNGDLLVCQPIDDSILARRFLNKGWDERGLLDWMEARVKPGDKIIDVGAAYGMFSRTFARKGANVVAVEADPTSSDRIRRIGLTFGSGKIDLVERAVSNEPGVVTFAGMGRSSAGVGKIIASDTSEDVAGFLKSISSLSQVSLNATSPVEQKQYRSFIRDDVDVLQIEATTIDRICEEKNLRDVALMKMDIEGGELKALQGAADLLDGTFGMPPIVVFEYSTLFPMRGGSHEDVLDIFLKRGWLLFHLSDGKTKGGSLIRVTGADDAPKHDNLISIPPGHPDLPQEPAGA